MCKGSGEMIMVRSETSFVPLVAALKFGAPANDRPALRTHVPNVSICIDTHSSSNVCDMAYGYCWSFGLYGIFSCFTRSMTREKSY